MNDSTTSTARRRNDRLIARFRDEHAGPPNGTEVAMRCTAHGTFIMWVSPPAPPSRMGCSTRCPALETM